MAASWPRQRVDRPLATCALGFAGALACSFCDAWPLPFGLLVSPAVAPLVLFIAVCVSGSFFPGWSFFLPVVSRGPRGRAALSLSFDDGPDPSTTPLLLDLLARHRARAAFFVIGKSAQAHPELVARIRAEGHEIGNHSLSHDSMLMLRSLPRLRAEIAGCQQILERQGVRPLAFRPPVGITNPRLGQVLESLGLGCVGFSCRPLDWGNQRIAGLGARVLADVRPGDIVLLHDVAPPRAKVEEWLAEVERILSGVKERGLQVVPLAELIGLPITAPVEGTAPNGQASAPAGRVRAC